jgi:hypothetical protein
MGHRFCRSRKLHKSRHQLAGENTRTYILFAAARAIATPAAASDKTDAMMPIHQFIDNLDKGDMKAASAAYAPQAGILDEFPPHAWQGATAFADWGRDFGTFSQKAGDTEPFVKLGKPRHIDITDARIWPRSISAVSVAPKSATITTLRERTSSGMRKRLLGGKTIAASRMANRCAALRLWRWAGSRQWISPATGSGT